MHLDIIRKLEVLWQHMLYFKSFKKNDNAENITSFFWYLVL